jgi:hypothetical protein
MSRWTLFLMVFLTITLVGAAWRERVRGNYALAIAFAALPIAGWVAVILGKDALACP